MKNSNGTWAVYKCDGCNKPFAVPSIMVEAKEDGGEEHKEFSCPYCTYFCDNHNFYKYMSTEYNVIKKQHLN